MSIFNQLSFILKLQKYIHEMFNNYFVELKKENLQNNLEFHLYKSRNK